METLMIHEKPEQTKPQTVSQDFLLSAHLIPYEEATPVDWLEWASTIG